jgi:aminopeptidase N
MALTHLCLAARSAKIPAWPGQTLQRFTDAGNMTDRFNALSAGHQRPRAGRQALARFHALFAEAPGHRQVVQPAGRA